jgi:hypothetical protein
MLCQLFCFVTSSVDTLVAIDWACFGKLRKAVLKNKLFTRLQAVLQNLLFALPCV